MNCPGVMCVAGVSLVLLAACLSPPGGQRFATPEAASRSPASLSARPTAAHPADDKALVITDRIMDVKYSSKRSSATVDIVMIHFSSNVKNKPNSPYDVADNVSNYEHSNTSAHYLIDREGKVFRLVNEDRAAHHAGQGSLPADRWPGDARKNKLNDTSIGIELLAIGTKKEMETFGVTSKQYDRLPKEHIGFTESQYKSLKQLLAEIASRNRAVKLDRTHIIGHDEYAPGRRPDPGKLFDWAKIGLSKKP